MVLFPKGADVIMEPILVLFPPEPEHRRQLEAAAPGAKFFYGAEGVSEAVLRRVRAQREAESRRPPAKPPAEYRPSTQEDADRAKRWIAKIRAQAGWTG